MSNKKIIDITVPIDQQLAVWPGSCSAEFKTVNSMKKGDKSNDTEYRANVHCGTHMDAPLHFVDDGKTIDQIDLDQLIGEVYVAEIRGTNEITAGHLKAKKLPAGIKRLLIKTDNSRLWQDSPDIFHKDFAAFKADAAQWLVDNKIELIGIDYLSVQKYGDDPAVHQILLGAEIVVVEGLYLAEVSEGFYDLICLPIKLAGVEAAPVRAVLINKEKKR